MIYIDSKLPKDFITEYEIYDILKNYPDTVVKYRDLEIIVSKNNEEDSIYVELHNGKKKKKYGKL